MKDRPKFREYLFNRSGYTVKCKDGSCYSCKNYEITLGICLGIFFILAFGIFLANLLIVSDRQFWSGSSFEIIIGGLLAGLAIAYLAYRFTRFERIPENSEDYENASKLKFPRKQFLVPLIMWGVLVLFYALQSTGMMYVRWWLSDGTVRLAEAQISFSSDEASVPLDGSSPSAPVEIPDLPPESIVSVSITTANSPVPLQVELDGRRAYVSESDGRYHPFWEPDYFLQYASIEVPYRDIRDGSTLTLTCGDLVREWVFDVADEEDA